MGVVIVGFDLEMVATAIQQLMGVHINKPGIDEKIGPVSQRALENEEGGKESDCLFCKSIRLSR